MTELSLFPDEAALLRAGGTREGAAGREDLDRCGRVERSSLWAAYGDALGWIGELTDQAGLMRRTAGAPLTAPISWRRRIGGRFGVTVELPRGCYSDDSQLRLATSRAIRSDGFDVEAFAKVELPVWLSYGLGGGRSTSLAAERLGRPKSTWWNNSFRGWTGSGGNGAAMRIQPHVYAARRLEQAESFLPDVVRNAVCTHSHPTGLIGAVLQALCVAHSLRSGHVPSPHDLSGFLGLAARLPEMIGEDRELGLWRASFERTAGSFGEAWSDSVNEARDAVGVLGAGDSDAPAPDRYERLIASLGLREPAQRGSGMLTAVAAAGLAWFERRPGEAMRIAANATGTDTDTIATMAGAILGAVADSSPPDVMDAALFRSEAQRLTEIASGGSPGSHPYPDLLHWLAPKARADALVRSERGDLVVRGLGRVAEVLAAPIEAPSSGFLWRWCRLEYGQTLLIKHRREVRYGVEERRAPSTRENAQVDDARSATVSAGLPEGGLARRDPSIYEEPAGPSRFAEASPRTRTYDIREVVSYVEQRIDDDREVGRALRHVVRKGTVGEIAAFNAALVDLLRRTVGERERRNLAGTRGPERATKRRY